MKKINNVALKQMMMDRDFDDVILFPDRKKIIKKFKMDEFGDTQNNKKTFNRFDKRNAVYVS